jgi:hypothetical protein
MQLPGLLQAVLNDKVCITCFAMGPQVTAICTKLFLQAA